MKTLLNKDCFFDDITGTSILVLALFLKITDVKGVIYNVPLSVSTEELLLCAKEQQDNFIKRFI